MNAYIWVTRSLTISFRIVGVSSFRLSSGGALIQAIMDGLHVFGILKSFGVSEDEDEATEIASSPLGGLNGLSGLEKEGGSIEDDLLRGSGEENCSGKIGRD